MYEKYYIIHVYVYVCMATVLHKMSIQAAVISGSIVSSLG